MVKLKAYWTCFAIFIAIDVRMITSADSHQNHSTKINPLNDDHSEQIKAESIMTASNNWIKGYRSKLRNIFLSSNQKYNQINSAPLLQELNKQYKEFIYELTMNLSSFHHVNQFQNEHLRRQIKWLGQAQFRGLPDDKYQQTQDILRKFQSFTRSKLVCKYPDNCNERIAYFPNINNIIESTKDNEILEYYWLKWRESINTEANNLYFNYIELYRQTAIMNGHFRPSKTWYHHYDDDDNNSFINELENAIKQLQSLYKEFHSYIRYVLRQHYGKHITEDHGLIPQHLMEEIIAQAWKAKPVFEAPYPNRKLPNIKQKMDQDRFTPITIIDLSARFYNSLGFEDLPETFWSNYSRKFSDDDAYCSKAQIYYFPPDVALKYCPKIDFKKFLQMHGHMTELQYNCHRGRLPFGLDNEACPGFGGAIGEAAIIAAGSSSYLEKIKLIENYTLDNHLSLNRIFRMGIHTIFQIPMYFVNEKFWVDSIDNEFKASKFNCHYWKLQEKYAGIAPPTTRTNSNLDPGHKFYSGIDPDHPNTIKLVSELLGYQFYRSLCIKSRQYVPGDPLKPLHNCDYSSSHEVGKLIQEMMSLGSTKNWRHIMEILTGDREISASAILEYYQPLYLWLKEQNKKHNNYVGWDSTENCKR